MWLVIIIILGGFCMEIFEARVLGGNLYWEFDKFYILLTAMKNKRTA
jgi:hypothetical protein